MNKNTDAQPNRKKRPQHTRIIKAIILLVLAIGLFVTPRVKIPWVDHTADTYFVNTITKAGISYASLRTINAVISPIKQSEVQVQPAGFGITIAAGEVLDPLDKMIEQTASVFLASITSLGVQRVVYDLSVALAPLIIAICIILYLLDSLRKRPLGTGASSPFTKAIILTLAVRLCLPISGLASMVLDNYYFANKIDTLQTNLDNNVPESRKAIASREDDEEGFFDGLIGKYAQVKDKASNMLGNLAEMAGKADDIMANAIQMTFLYITLFIIQVLVIPIGSFWILLRIARRLTNHPISVEGLPGGKLLSNPPKS